MHFYVKFMTLTLSTFQRHSKVKKSEIPVPVKFSVNDPKIIDKTSLTGKGGKSVLGSKGKRQDLSSSQHPLASTSADPTKGAATASRLDRLEKRLRPDPKAGPKSTLTIAGTPLDCKDCRIAPGLHPGRPTRCKQHCRGCHGNKTCSKHCQNCRLPHSRCRLHCIRCSPTVPCSLHRQPKSLAKKK